MGTLEKLRDVLPRGRPLQDEVWQRRNRAFVILLWVHVIGLPIFGIVRGQEVLHSNRVAAIGSCQWNPGSRTDRSERARRRRRSPTRRTDRARRRGTDAQEGTAGTGLGLAIVGATAAAHGGRAWYEPREGGGSRFCLLIPENGVAAGPPS